ncbi:phosphocholine cytidylyltransferase family protein [Candidatus Bathyarchaeota archaeon]|nr:phosphocholine cytidylyltransferase family protein [Candidatus Bathyarchaeota archaeon]RJS74825.1 MAG: phosphocholine cytidylyltransferase family protein [Candidatus Bathyarchaeota archaeon]
MQALIIAAGRGERFRPLTDKLPKPLIPLLGLRLIERVILSAKEAGVGEFVIVTGYMGWMIRDFLDDGSRYGVKIRYVESKRWRLGNGLSVYEARGTLSDRFILLMSDHIFNPEVLRGLMSCRLGENECILCVDVGMKDVVDLEEATKVKVVGDRIVDIGKGLNEYNGVDMGIFLCSNAIFDALGRAIESGRYTLTDGVKELVKKGRMRAYRIDDENAYWIDVDTPACLKTAENILRRYGIDLEKPLIDRLNLPQSIEDLDLAT